MMSYRPPAVAGIFYSNNPQELSQNIHAFLQQNDKSSHGFYKQKALKALIVPHAGYIYSGAVAASAYSLLQQSQQNLKIILLGPSHRVAFDGIALPDADAFETPLGLVKLDENLMARCKQLKNVFQNNAAHRDEHSLEVQLPFLQITLKDFTLLPLLVGNCEPETVNQLLEITHDDNTLIIVSSDLSHYHEYQAAQLLDQLTSRNIEQLHDSPITHEHACGKIPVQGLLQYARNHSLSVETLDLRNSGDTAGNQDRVVGYGAYAFS